MMKTGDDRHMEPLITIEDLRNRFNELHGHEIERRDILGIIGDIILYLEDRELSPQLLSNRDTIELVEAGRDK